MPNKPTTLREVEYQGHKYTSDGESVWRDGELVSKISGQIKIIEEEKVLSLDGGKNLYFNGQLYYPASHNAELLQKIEKLPKRQRKMLDGSLDEPEIYLSDVINIINQE